MDSISSSAASQLKTVVSRFERLEEDRKAVVEDIKQLLLEAKGNGFDAKTVRKVVKIRALDRNKMQEAEAILDLYMSAIGDDDWRGTGSFAARFVQKDDEAPELPLEPASPPPVADTVDEARAKGMQAGHGGQPVTSNPYPAGTPQRAAWDAAWCAATGTDGMDIPADLKKGGKKKPGGGK